MSDQKNPRNTFWIVLMNNVFFFFLETNHWQFCKQQGVSVWWLKYLNTLRKLNDLLYSKFIFTLKITFWSFFPIIETTKKTEKNKKKNKAVRKCTRFKELSRKMTESNMTVCLLFSSGLMQNNSGKPLARKKCHCRCSYMKSKRKRTQNRHISGWLDPNDIITNSHFTFYTVEPIKKKIQFPNN